jgi:IS5 family transposase
MSYIRQELLFTYEEFVGDHDDNERLVLTLAALPAESLLRWLEGQRDGRRNDYPVRMLWQCLIAKSVYQIEHYSELIRELQRNGTLRRLVGIPSRGQVPHDYHFSRLLKKLSSSKGLELLEEMFNAQVIQLSSQLPQMGKHLTVDATAVHAYSNEMRKDKSDPDAAWSARPARQRRHKNSDSVQEQLQYWFGYQVHLVVDHASELPVAFEVTAANENETNHLQPLLESLTKQHPELMTRTEAVVADAGYDSTSNCSFVLDKLKALPIIKMRLEKGQSKDAPYHAATSLCNQLGTQLCEGGGAMAYDGRDGDYLKWRCPLACGKIDKCQAFGRCSASKYGTVRKIAIAEDPRRFPGLARESKKWVRLYRKRTAAERVNGRLKDFLLLDQLTVRGMNKVTAHVSIALLVMLAGAEAMVRADRLDQVRHVVRLAA